MDSIKIDTRVICATNQDLSDRIKNGLFREDLFYRINVVSINMPPLRERKSDISMLSDYFLRKYAIEIQKDVSGISKDAISVLTRYSWPGNVRELSNVIKSAIVFCKHKQITSDNLPDHIKQASQSKPYTLSLPSRSLPFVESELIHMVLQEKDWNLTKAADELNIARGTLYSKMKKYDLCKS